MNKFNVQSSPRVYKNTGAHHGTGWATSGTKRRRDKFQKPLGNPNPDIGQVLYIRKAGSHRAIITSREGVIIVGREDWCIISIECLT